MIFIDEPILTALGTSSYIGVHTDEARRLLSEMVAHIKTSGALAGIHCCSKTDWSLVLSTGLDVLNFDAYFYWDSVRLYPEEIKRFLNNGGFIAWGIIPTTDAIRGLTLQVVREQLERGLDSLENLGVSPEKLRTQLLLTPSCGTGSMETKDSLKVFSLLKKLKDSYVKG
jgi:hypothetical protein